MKEEVAVNNIRDGVVDVSASAYHYTFQYGITGDASNTSTLVRLKHVNTGTRSQNERMYL